MRKLTIHKPKIVPGIDDGHCRLSATIETDHFKKDLYYEVENKYREYLCDERGDAFMLALLNFSLVNGYDMTLEAPVSEKLYYQITQQYIPTVYKYNKDFYNNIQIEAETDGTPIKNVGAVGASVSRGVDSFYTLLKNAGLKTKDYNITHLMICSTYQIYRGEEDTRRRFAGTVANAVEAAGALGLPFVAIYSNEHEFWFRRCVNLHTLRYVGHVYALQKLFSAYNFSSGFTYRGFDLSASNKATAHYDFLTAQLVSSENLTIYSSGPEASRLEKVEFIADDPVVRKYLRVCNTSTENCGVCWKCRQTQMELFAAGKLDMYRDTFPVDKFQGVMNKEFRIMYGRRDEDDLDLIEVLREKHRIPFIPRMLGTAQYWFLKKLRDFAKRFKPVREWYYKYRAGKVKETDMEEFKSVSYNLDREYAASCDDIVS